MDNYGHNSLWDRMPTPVKWFVGIVAVVYFGGGFIVPFFW